jgi:hypothetical protein
VLVFNCPVTRKLVRTSIETSAAKVERLGSIQLSLWCPNCQTGHQVVASDARIEDNDSEIADT